MTARDILSPPAVILALLLVVATLAGFVLVPAGTTLPVHWGITGEADGVLPRDPALLLLPLIALLAVALLTGVQRFASRERREASRHVLAVAIPGILLVFLAIQAGIVLIGMGYAIDMVRIVVGAVGLLFVVLGNALPKSRPNWIAGIRLPWTIADSANWQATHRLGGLLMMLGGIAIVLAAIVTGQPVVLLAVTIVGALLPMIIASLYSYRLARRGNAGSGQSRL